VKVPFPKATVYCQSDASKLAPMKIETNDGRVIFLAFETLKKAATFCRQNRGAGLPLSPIHLDRGPEQIPRGRAD